MYPSDPELIQLAESISARYRRTDFETLLASAELYSLVELNDPQGEYAPILIKREFTLAILQDLRARGKLAQLLQLVYGDRPAISDPSPTEQVSAGREGDTVGPSAHAPRRSATARLSAAAARLRGVTIDWKLVIAALALAVALLVFLYGNNLCQQPSPPPWTVPVLTKVCPLPRTPTPPVSTSATASTPIPATATPQVVRVGVIRIPDYIYTEIVPNLALIGFEAQWIDHTSDYGDYRDFDVIYLPAGWGYQSAVLHERKPSITSFLENGGGLFIERPNAADSFTVYFLPGEISFAPEVFDPLEYPSTILNHHEIVDGLDPADLPELGNLIEGPSEQYLVLTVSAKSNHPTLLVSESSGGRVVITSSTLATSEDIGHPLSPELVRRALLWLARRSVGS